MKVLLIDVNCKESSTGKIVYSLFTHINANGGEAAICYGRGRKIVEPNVVKFGIDIETYLHAFLTRLTGYTGCFSYFSTKRLIGYIKRFKPDIVHIHELHAYFVNIKPLLIYLRNSHIKTIITLHCEFTYTGKCGHSIDCEKWKTECGNCQHLHDYPNSLLFDHTRHMFLQKKRLLESFEDLTIVSPSQWLADRVKKSFLKNHEIVVLHNGVDTGIFYPRDTTELRAKYHIQNGEKVVLALATNLMSKEKGGQYILQLAKRMNDLNIRFFLIGIDEKIKEYADNVVILGRINDKELLAQYYSMADVFVICSERENFPTTCLEAQCCGTPVCGFDTGGSKETAINDFMSFVPYGDLDKLSLAIIDNFKNKSIYQDLIRELSCNKYETIYMEKRYLMLYKSALEK